MPRTYRGVKSVTQGKQWELFNCPMGVKITVIVQEGLKTDLLMCYRVIVQEVIIINMLVQEGLLKVMKRLFKYIIIFIYLFI